MDRSQLQHRSGLLNCYTIIQSNMLSKYLEGHTESTGTSNMRYRVSVLVDMECVSWGLSELYSPPKSTY